MNRRRHASSDARRPSRRPWPSGRPFYFAGFEVEVGSPSYTPGSDTSAGRVEVEAALTNLGSDAATFDGTPSLASAGMFYEPSFDQELPQVPGASTGAGAFVFDVDPSFTLNDAVLTIGLAENHRAVVPLGSTGEAVSLEPTTLTVRGKTKAGLLSLDLPTARRSPRTTARSSC